MRLLTHNLLACSARTCLTTSNNFPLALKDVQLEVVEAEYNEGFLKGLMGGGKIDWRGCRWLIDVRDIRRFELFDFRCI